MSSVLIVALGNEVMGDDGVGIKIGRELKRQGYKVEELGTDIFSLMRVYNGENKVIIVDAVLGEIPGKVVYFKGEDIFKKLRAEIRSAHFMGAVEGLKLLLEVDERLKNAELHFVGVTIKEPKLGLELSEEVKRAIPRAMELILSIIREGE
ncbi:protein frxA [Pyrococcus furiosus DSM 3638]|nr:MULTISPECIES: hydrogenase maturation protease [Pyrococcus]MDK2869828.1 hydrogenase maturation protease [Pyrococcus sp.]QEK78641.1 protein frxA [Pyrococcus furiosus DSM 3638]